MRLAGALLEGMSQVSTGAASVFQLPSTVGIDFSAEVGEFLDLRHCGHPLRMSRDEVLKQLLLPAARAGELGETTEAEVQAEAEKLTLDELRDWGAEYLKANPWPPAFHLPTFYEFVTSPAYLNSDAAPTERQRKAIEDSVGPSAYDWFVAPRRVSTVILCWGKGSGKDLLSNWVCAYVAWSVSWMRNPWFHFNMPMGEVLDIVNVAQDQDSAREVFFTKLKNSVQKECFAQLLDRSRDIQADSITFRKSVPGELFPRICVRINSLHSKNEKAEGRNTFFWIMDEADALRDSKGHGNARKMYNTLTTSNRFGSRQMGFIISYPRAKNGFIFEMLDKCANRGGGTPEWWGDLAPTYRVLPWKCFIPCLVDGVEKWTNPVGYVSNEPDNEMVRLYRDDPETFRAMYEVEPPAAEDAFIGEQKRIDECVVPYLRPCAVVETTIHEDRDPTTNAVYQYAALVLSQLQLRPNAAYFIGGDAGEVEDSFALCLAHVIPSSERGFLSADAWRDPRLRLAKHYRPLPLPVWDPDWRAERWRCDVTGEIPVPGKHQFWGVCDAAGRKVLRPVRIGETDDGTPIYAKDAAGMDRLEEVQLPVVVQDLLLEWRPNRAKGTTVDFRNVRDVILLLAQHCRIGMCLFDKWQAIQIIQELRAAGIPAETKAFGNAAQLEWYRHYKLLLYNHQVQLLPGEERARRQLRELQLVNGTKIDHPQYSGGGGLGAKDLTDAEALAFWTACQDKYQPAQVDCGGGAAFSIMNQQAAAVTLREQQQASLVDGVLRGHAAFPL